MADRVRRRHDVVADDVVGELQKRAHEDAIALRSFREPGLPVAHGRKLLRHEAAFRADRDDHRVLHLLRLDEAEHLGAEILRPVGPAQAPARDLAEAQVHALDARRIDEDLVERTRQRQRVDLGAFELEGDRCAGQPVLVDLEEVRADCGFDEIGEAAQDAVIIKACHRLELVFDLGADSGLPRGPIRFGTRVETGIEQRDDLLCDAVVPRQRFGEIILRVGDAGLPQVAAERAHHGDIAPAEAGFEDEAVEGVGFGKSPEERQKRRFDRSLDLLDGDGSARGTLERHVVQPDALVRSGVGRGDTVGPLVDDAEAEIFEKRHTLRERQGAAARKDLEVDAHRAVAFAAIKIDRARPRFRKLFEDGDVGDRQLGAERLLIGRAEGVRIARREHARPRAADGFLQPFAQGVAPGADDAGDAALERLALDLRRCPSVAADNEMRPRERPFRVGGVGGGERAPRRSAPGIRRRGGGPGCRSGPSE